jgi:hypothetical protein
VRTVPAVYLDGSLLDAPGTAGAIDDLRHLSDAGFELVRLTASSADGKAAEPPRPATPSPGASVDAPAMRTAEQVDSDERGAWLLTADPHACGRARPVICRTILVGPTPPDGAGPARCDHVVRDIRSAVLEILASDAMR